MRSLLTIALALLFLAPAVRADGPERDPRNWPTLARYIADRHDMADRTMTFRVYARASDYFNCGYRHRRGELMAFTLLGGPMETLTGYMPRELGVILVQVLERDPWTPITVKVRYDPNRLSDICPDQVEIQQWSPGWQYPRESLTPGRPDPRIQPSRADLATFEAEIPLWNALMKRRRGRHAPDAINPDELIGATIRMRAGAQISNAWFCAFKGTSQTHYALRLFDHQGGMVHAYLPHSDAARDLLDYVALHRRAAVEVEGRVVQQTPSNYCPPQLDLTGWTLHEPDGD